MKATFILFLLPAALCLAQEEAAPKNELAFGLGGIPVASRSNSPSLDAGSGVAYQVNHGRRFLSNRKVALYGEINFVASPLREVSSSVGDSRFRESPYHAWNSPEISSGVEEFAVRSGWRRICQL
jgi:hypothetical protein